MAKAKKQQNTTTGKIEVNVYDGRRELYSDRSKLLITIRDGNQKNIFRDFRREASITFGDLPIYNNFGDDYTVLAAAKGYRDAGAFPVKVSANLTRAVDLLLVPSESSLNFARAKWSNLAGQRPKVKDILTADLGDEDAAAKRYGDLMENQGEIVACFLNLTTAMAQLQLPAGTPMDYLRSALFDAVKFKPARDRWFLWAYSGLMLQVLRAVDAGVLVQVPAALHPGATHSYKQVEFGEANLQLTFHENDTKVINGTKCVLLEVDMDYFKDPVSHFILEVAVNAFGSIDDPKTVYALRWMAGRKAGIPEFDPLYTIEKIP